MAWLQRVVASVGEGIAKPIGSAIEKHAEVRKDPQYLAAQIQIAEARSTRINGWFRALIAFGPALYLFKIFAVDKVVCPVFGLSAAYCRTDSLDANLWKVVTAIVGFYFLYEGSLGVARIVRGKR